MEKYRIVTEDEKEILRTETYAGSECYELPDKWKTNSTLKT